MKSEKQRIKLQEQHNIILTETDHTFIRNNDIVTLSPYIKILKTKIHCNNIPIDELKNIYLLDKEIRIFMYSLLEELETALKSIINNYIIEYNTLDLNNKNSYLNRGIITLHNKENFNIYQKVKDKSLHKLTFGQLSILIANLNYNHHQKLKNHIIDIIGVKPKQLFKKLEQLVIMRNAIAHHNSIIEYSIRNRTNIQVLVQQLSHIIKRLRIDIDTHWQNKIEIKIKNRTSNYKKLAILIGYPVVTKA